MTRLSSVVPAGTLIAVGAPSTTTLKFAAAEPRALARTQSLLEAQDRIAVPSTPGNCPAKSMTSEMLSSTKGIPSGRSKDSASDCRFTPNSVRALTTSPGVMFEKSLNDWLSTVTSMSKSPKASPFNVTPMLALPMFVPPRVAEMGSVAVKLAVASTDGASSERVLPRRSVAVMGPARKETSTFSIEIDRAASHTHVSKHAEVHLEIECLAGILIRERRVDVEIQLRAAEINKEGVPGRCPRIGVKPERKTVGKAERGDEIELCVPKIEAQLPRDVPQIDLDVFLRRFLRRVEQIDLDLDLGPGRFVRKMGAEACSDSHERRRVRVVAANQSLPGVTRSLSFLVGGMRHRREFLANIGRELVRSLSDSTSFAKPPTRFNPSRRAFSASVQWELRLSSSRGLERFQTVIVAVKPPLRAQPRRPGMLRAVRTKKN